MKMESLTPDEREFVQILAASLPPIIARKEASRYLGGAVALQTLANADAKGKGPKIAYKVGRGVVYRTDSLLLWIVERLGVSKINHQGLL